MATARQPASARAGSCARQVHQNSGKPCSSRTTGPRPGPVSTTWNRAPLAATYRCCQGPGISTGSVSEDRSTTLEDALGLLCLVDRALRSADLLDLSRPDEAQQCGDQHVEHENDQEAPGQVEPGHVDEVRDRDREHDDREHTDESRTGEQPDAEAAGLHADLELRLGKRDLTLDQGGDVAAGVGDETPESRVVLAGDVGLGRGDSCVAHGGLLRGPDPTGAVPGATGGGAGQRLLVRLAAGFLEVVGDQV